MDKIEREKLFHNKAFSDHCRGTIQKYYSIAQSSRTHYVSLLGQYGAGKKVLEYGCGPGSSAFMLAERGAAVQGIDISEVAIDRASQQEAQKKLGVTFQVMNAERLAFADDSFDLICGSGILHHLQLDKAFAELARTLHPDGKAVFLEPLGHNPLINLYRKQTPELRTEDEHPLLVRDLKLAGSYFSNVSTHFFHFTSLSAFVFRNTRIFPRVLTMLEWMDNALFQLLPFLRRYAWAVVIVLQNRKSGAGSGAA